MLTRENNRRSFALPVLLGSGIWLAFCWSMLFGLSVPGFRDSSYLYYPLFEWLDSEWSKGQVPLWNPFCNLGMSNVGDNTTSLFYPGKLIFFLRFLDYPTRYGLYISLHILLAGLGAFYIARVMRASVPGATLAAISYAGSGAVLTQATNVVYLVSAAWLPFTLAAIWQMIRPKKQSGFRSGFIAGIFCALMILGGDPQMVYHVGMIAAATIAFNLPGRLRHKKISSNQTLAQSESRIRHLLRPVLSFSVMVAVTTLLALVQIVPTYQWSKLSERSVSGQPRVFELLSQYLKPTKTQSEPTSDSNLFVAAHQYSSWKSLVEPLNPNSVSFANYEFSLPPWTLAELFVPGGNGRSFPIHQRWADVLPSPHGMPDRVWFFSIYLGSATAWLGLSGLRLRRAGRRAWLSRIATFFLLGSFGWYGLSWLLPIPDCGSHVGGVYWWMNLLLPSYSSFRYPAKLFVIVSLTLSVLAGLQLNARTFRSLNPLNSFFWGWLGLIGIGMVAIHLNGFQTQIQALPNDPLFGPFDLNGSIQSLKFSLLHAFLLAGLLMLISLWFVTRVGFGQQKTSLPLWILVAITALDLVIANRWILALVPREAFIAEVSMPALTNSGIAPMTVYRKRDAYMPDYWQSSNSFDRLTEILRWQRETLYPKHHLGHHVRLMGSFGSIQPKQNEHALNMLDGLPNGVEPPPSPPNRRLTSEEVLTKLLLRLKKQDCDGELVSVSTNGVNRSEVTYWRERPRLVFLRRVEKEDQPRVDAKFTGECEMIEFASNSILLRVTCTEDCELVHASLFDGNWEATVNSISTGHTTNLKLVELGSGRQGLTVQPGKYEIRLDYVPRAFWKSAWVSLIAWLMAFAYLAGRWRK